MVLYVGETVTIKVAATNPLKGNAVIADGVCTVELYAVDTDPKGDPAARTVVGAPHAAAWDAEAQAYLAYIPTDGFAAGKHPYRAVLAGAYDSWEYGAFTLKV